LLSKEIQSIIPSTKAENGKDFPLDNLVYDLISVIHEKSQALEAYEACEQDAYGKTEFARLFKGSSNN
jgi:hypothetical protein